MCGLLPKITVRFWAVTEIRWQQHLISTNWLPKDFSTTRPMPMLQFVPRPAILLSPVFMPAQEAISTCAANIPNLMLFSFILIFCIKKDTTAPIIQRKTTTWKRYKPKVSGMNRVRMPTIKTESPDNHFLPFSIQCFHTKPASISRFQQNTFVTTRKR